MRGIEGWKRVWGVAAAAAAVVAAAVPLGAEGALLENVVITRQTSWGDQSTVPDAPVSLAGTHTGWTWSGFGANYQPAMPYDLRYDNPIGRVNGNAQWDVHQRGSYNQSTSTYGEHNFRFYGGAGLGWARTSPAQHGLKWVSTKLTLNFDVQSPVLMGVGIYLNTSALLTNSTGSHDGFAWNRSEYRFEGHDDEGYIYNWLHRSTSIVDQNSSSSADEDELIFDPTYQYRLGVGSYSLTLEAISQVKLPVSGAGGVWNRSGYMTYTDPTPDLNWDVELNFTKFVPVWPIPFSYAEGGETIVVPEPASLTLAGLLAGGLTLTRRRG